MDKKQKDQYFDDALKNRFSNREELPKNIDFSAIQEQFATNQLDKKIKGRLEGFTQTPPIDIWDKIKPEIPLNLFVKVQLHRLSKIAAVLLMGSFATYLYSSLPTKETPTTVASTVIQEEKVESEAANDFVFAIKEDQSIEEDLSIKKVEKKRKKTRKSPEIDDFLALLLEEDDFGEDLDLSTVKNALRPAEELSANSLTASIDDTYFYYDEDVDPKDVVLRIDPYLTLQVVEPWEVDELIRRYDERVKKK